MEFSNVMHISQKTTDQIYSTGMVGYDIGGTGDNVAIKNTTNYYPQLCDYWNTYHYYYPVTYQVFIPQEKTQIALKVAKMLLEKKLIKIILVKEFIDLMDSLLGVL